MNRTHIPLAGTHSHMSQWMVIFDVLSTRLYRCSVIIEEKKRRKTCSLHTTRGKIREHIRSSHQSGRRFCFPSYLISFAENTSWTNMCIAMSLSHTHMFWVWRKPRINRSVATDLIPCSRWIVESNFYSRERSREAEIRMDIQLVLYFYF